MSKYRLPLLVSFSVSLVVNASGATLDIDFSKKTAESSGMIFGTCGGPWRGGAEAWERFKRMGITSVRMDMTVDRVVPCSTLQDYRENANNVQDTSTWNWQRFEWLRHAKAQGVTTIGIVSYGISWLSPKSADTSISRRAKTLGLPRDLDLYADIVAKMIAHNKGYLDYISIWNEPDLSDFLDTLQLDGLAPVEAYIRIYERVWKAIRAVDSTTPIGGPGLSDFPGTETWNGLRHRWMETFLSDPRTRGKVDFMEFHTYWHHDYRGVVCCPGGLTAAARTLLADHSPGKEVPVFLTEWNVHWREDSCLGNDPSAITFVGARFVQFIREGIKAANIYRAGSGPQGIQENETTPHLFMRVWTVASEQLGLGNGEFPAVQSRAEGVEGVGCLAPNGAPVVLMAGSEHGDTVRVAMKNVSVAGREARVELFLASPDNDGSRIWESMEVRVRRKQAGFSVVLPPHSVVGARVIEAAGKN